MEHVLHEEFITLLSSHTTSRVHLLSGGSWRFQISSPVVGSSDSTRILEHLSLSDVAGVIVVPVPPPPGPKERLAVHGVGVAAHYDKRAFSTGAVSF